MVSVDISLTPSLPGATLSLSGSQNKRILGDFMGLCFFGRLRLRQKEGVMRIYRSKRDRRDMPRASQHSFTRRHRPAQQQSRFQRARNAAHSCAQMALIRRGSSKALRKSISTMCGGCQGVATSSSTHTKLHDNVQESCGARPPLLKNSGVAMRFKLYFPSVLDSCTADQ